MRRHGTFQNVEAARAGACPRWSCPCVEPRHQGLLLPNKRQDPTSHFRRTTLFAANRALDLTGNVLNRIVSHHSCIAARILSRHLLLVGKLPLPHILELCQRKFGQHQKPSDCRDPTRCSTTARPTAQFVSACQHSATGGRKFKLSEI